MPYGSMLHIPPTNLLLLAAKQEPYEKAYLLTKQNKKQKKYWRTVWKKVQKNVPTGRKKSRQKEQQD